MIYIHALNRGGEGVKINGGIFIKHIRQVIEEEYKDFEILDGSGQRSVGRNPSEFSPVPDF